MNAFYFAVYQFVYPGGRNTDTGDPIKEENSNRSIKAFDCHKK